MIKNGSLKAFSVLLACILAYAVNSESNSSVVSLFLPVEVKNLPDSKVIVRPTKRSVQVTLKGPSFIIGPVASSPPAIRVNLPTDLEDRYLASFNSAELNLPPSVDVVGFDPAEMEFAFETLERRDARIEVPRLGQLPKHLILEGIELSPRSVVLTGPRNEVRSIKLIGTDPIDLREILATTTVDLRIRLPGTQTTASVERVTAKIIVSELPIEKTFLNRKIQFRSGSIRRPNLSSSANEVDITVSGDRDRIQALAVDSVIPFVPVGPLKTTGEAVLVEVDLPTGVKLVKVEPPTIIVKTNIAKR